LFTKEGLIYHAAFDWNDEGVVHQSISLSAQEDTKFAREADPGQEGGYFLVKREPNVHPGGQDRLMNR
jgi:hypothetical protein